MPADTTTTTRWDTLHTDQRHQLEYPSEHVVRFLSRFDTSHTILDIGCGSGRHARLAEDLGWHVSACDHSEPAVARTRTRLNWYFGNVRMASMTALPYTDGSFDAAIAYGVFYYATMGDADKAAQEMFRVLRPGGHAIVTVRTDRDWRTKHINRDNVFDLPGEPEDGMALDFISDDELHAVYGNHKSLHYELAEWTTHDRARLNSDWIITVTK